MKIQTRCALTVDVEDWFHLIGAGLDYQFREPVPKAQDWDTLPQRVCDSTRWILDMLDQFNTHATFFILGWVADRHSHLVREIADRGHEIASHGFTHRVLAALSPDEFRQDIRRADQAIADASGIKPLGFRASSASITDWAIEILAEEGYRYDASYYPASYHDVYGKLKDVNDSLMIEKHPCGIWLVKFSSLKIGKWMIPWSGGGYFRLMPYWFFRKGVLKILEQTGFYNFYIHPWEIDIGAPSPPNLKMLYRIRRMIGSRHSRERFAMLLREFRFSPVHVMLAECIEEMKAG